MRIRCCYILTAVLAGFCFLTAVTISAAPTLRSNGKIAFTSDRDGNPEIYVMNADGTNQVRITNNLVVDDHPTWSPDGTKIAFVSERPTGGFAIYKMNADGTGKNEITPIVLNDPPMSMSWSPDGKRLAFWDYQNNGDIFVVDLDGNNRQNLTNHPANDGQPAWSPDGSRILFTSLREYSNFRLYTIKPDGTDLQLLHSLNNIDDWSPSWSPNSDKIIFAVNENDFWTSLYTANADGTNRQLFADCLPCNYYLDQPKWSPDGNKIIFQIYTTVDTEIYVKNVDGAGFAQLTNTTGSNSNPSWQSLLANGSVSGTVTTPDGRGLRNAVISLTDPLGVVRTVTTSSFGFYSFANLVAGSTYTISVASRLFRFTPRTITVNDNLTDVDFVGLE